MAGLDGLIGAEERVINSKPKTGEDLPTFMQIGSTLCSPVTAWHISSPNSPGLREDFQTMFGL
ncbi:hypothetical protein CCH79_00019411 [Gambusia affinis]|uniref:Uncharacterized protein n=1 Tax=Gambusia affinis TaxID=33528 RepID=A0A315WAN3_GAMAF|nr:hypothetical protein CCH79_00019411 [Gambusia affinis]